jgi:hypothetical protein
MAQNCEIRVKAARTPTLFRSRLAPADFTARWYSSFGARKRALAPNDRQAE